MQAKWLVSSDVHWRLSFYPRLHRGLVLTWTFWLPIKIVGFQGIRMSLKWDTRRDKFGSLGRLLIFYLTLSVKLDQSTPFLRHLADLGMTGLQQILWLSSIMIGRLSELLIGSASLQDVFADQFLPQREMSGALSFPVIWLVRVAEPSLRMCRLLSSIQSRISSPCWSWGWIGSHI